MRKKQELTEKIKRSSPDKQHSNEITEQLKNEISALKNQKNALADQLSELNKEIEGLKEELKKSKEVDFDRGRENERLKEILAEGKKEIESLKQSLQGFILFFIWKKPLFLIIRNTKWFSNEFRPSR